MRNREGKRSPAKAQAPAADNASSGGNVHVLLPAVLFAALLVRVIALADFSRSIYGDFLLWDERVYQAWATHILQGKLFVVHEFGPLPAYVMAAVYGLFTNDPVYVRALNILFGVVTCLFIYLIGKDLASKTTGLLACLLAALYKPFIFFNITLLKESLGLLLFSVSIYCFVSLMKGSRPQEDNAPPAPSEQKQGPDEGRWSYGKVLLLGVTVGFLINVRQNSIVLLPVFPLFLLWHIYTKAFSARRMALTTAVYVMGLAIATAPFFFHNYRTTGDFIASPTGGFTLYIANNPGNPYAYYRPVPFATSAPSEQAVQFIIEASRRAGRKLSAREASSYWTREVIRTAIERPGPFAWKLWQKALTIVNQCEAEDNYDLGFTSRFVPFFRLPFFAFWFISPLGMAALLLSGRKSHNALGLKAVFVIYALTLIAFFSNMRIRLPLLVVLIPYAAIGINTLFRTVQKRLPLRGVRPYLIALAIFAVVEFLPLEGAGDLSGHYNTHAINLMSKGLVREAVRYWEESSDMKRPYSAYANLALARVYYREGDFMKGDAYLDKVPDDSFAAAGKYELMGDAWLKQGRSDQAVLAYEKSLRTNSGQLGPRTKLVRLYETRDLQKAREERARLTYIESFYRESRGL